MNNDDNRGCTNTVLKKIGACTSALDHTLHESEVQGLHSGEKERQVCPTRVVVGAAAVDLE